MMLPDTSWNLYDAMSTEQTKGADLVITNDLLTSHNSASNKYRMYLMDKSKEALETREGRKGKPFMKS